MVQVLGGCTGVKELKYKSRMFAHPTPVAHLCSFSIRIQSLANKLQELVLLEKPWVPHFKSERVNQLFYYAILVKHQFKLSYLKNSNYDSSIFLICGYRHFVGIPIIYDPSLINTIRTVYIIK